MALSIARENADAAIRLASVAEDSARREMRAYVTPQDIAVADFLPGKIPCFQFVPANTGKTPAYDVSASMVLNWSVGIDPHDTKILFRKFVTANRGSKSISAPGDRPIFDFPNAPKLGPLDYEAVMRGELQFVFAGIISYRDVFRRRRLSTFKFFLRPELLDGDGCARLSACTSGNSAN